MERDDPLTSPATPGCECRASGELGIALSGGGARGLAQLGVLKVLDREGVPVSYVAGTSVGAIVGAAYVTSRDATEAEERVLAHLRTTGIGFNAETFTGLANAGGSPGRLFNAVRGLWRAVQPGGSVVGGEAVRESLHVLFGDATFADTRVPFATTALDLLSGRRMIFAGGSLVDAVYASAAIPGVFEPFVLSDYVLVDGGWAEPIPVDACHHLGAIHIVAVDVPNSDTYEVDAHAVSTALRADALARDLLEEEQLRKADFVVRVGVQVRHFADIEDPERLVAAGERAAEAALPEIRAVLARHRGLFVRARASHDVQCGVSP